MALNIHERHLIDRYLNGVLSGIELEEFNQKMSSDADFKKATELQKLIYSGIAHARQEELKEKIKASIKYRSPGIPFPLKLIIAFFVILIFGITFWSYVGNEFERSKPYNNFISIFKKKDKNVLPEKTVSKLPAKVESERKDSIKASEENLKDTSAINSENISADTTSTLYEDDIEVKKDIMIVSTVFPVIDKSTHKDESLSKETAQKLPDADLPIEIKNDSMTVEFWVSPIHYKGYKMSKNTLVLFGIENLNDVMLYRVNNSIYMKYGQSYYPMNTTFDYTPYQKLKDSEIPPELK
jgi:hypothetical protein